MFTKREIIYNLQTTESPYVKSRYNANNFHYLQNTNRVLIYLTVFWLHCDKGVAALIPINWNGVTMRTLEMLLKSAKPLKRELRDWQFNPELGAACFIPNKNFNGIEKIICEPQFRLFYEAYSSFLVCLNYDHALELAGRLLKTAQRFTFERYAKTEQLELFKIESMQLIKQNEEN